VVREPDEFYFAYSGQIVINIERIRRTIHTKWLEIRHLVRIFVHFLLDLHWNIIKMHTKMPVDRGLVCKFVSRFIWIIEKDVLNY